MGYLEELASILGPREVSFHSQNNLYRVPIGLALPNSDQSPLLMHIEKTENILDNDDYIYPPAHKLILSITGAMKIKENCLPTAQSRLAIENVGSNFGKSFIQKFGKSGELKLCPPLLSVPW